MNNEIDVNASEQDISGPDFEDGAVADGFHQCTPHNGGHDWTSPYRGRLDWIRHCTKCAEKSDA
jgi:hypothetical protein